MLMEYSSENALMTLRNLFNNLKVTPSDDKASVISSAGTTFYWC